MSEQTIRTAAAEAEFDWLMSLALDDALDHAEQARFDALLADAPDLAESWRAWQWIDSEFTATPALTPPSGFVQRFDLRLAEVEKERQQRVLLLSSAAALLAVVLVFMTMAGMGALVFLTQGQWVGAQVRALALAYTSAHLWFATLGETVNAMINTPQAQLAAGLYALLLVMLVFGWVQLLRRSARLEKALPVTVD